MKRNALIEQKISIKASVDRCQWSVVSEDDCDFITSEMMRYKTKKAILMRFHNRQHAFSVYAQGVTSDNKVWKSSAYNLER